MIQIDVTEGMERGLIQTHNDTHTHTMTHSVLHHQATN